MGQREHLDTPRTSSHRLLAFACLALMMAPVTLPGTASAAEPAQPEITAVSPDHGPRSGGNTVVLTGADFTGATSVQFGPLEAESFTVNANSEITAIAPPSLGPGKDQAVVHISVSGPGGTSLETPADLYGYAPVINRIKPAYGPALGGTAVTLLGYGLEETTAVEFGSVPAEGFTVNPDGSVTAVSPPEVSGETIVPITATTPEGVTEDFKLQETEPANFFTYGPTVTSVTPNEGPAEGGTKVTIHGTGFKSPRYSCLCAFPFVYSVSFGPSILKCGLPQASGGLPCSPVEFEVMSETKIVALTPPGSGTVDIGVSTDGGDSPANSAVQFSYTGVPPPGPPEEPQVLQLLNCSVQAGTVGVCSARSVDASAVNPIAGPTARLYRGKTLYARGTARVHRNHSRLLLDPVRSLAPGRYMLVLSRPGNAGQGSHWPRRQPVIIK